MNRNDLRAVAILASMTAIATMFVVLCLALLSGVAHAQVEPMNPCNVPDPKTIRWYSDWVHGSKVSCAPAPIGTGTTPSIKANAAGIHGWAWCPLPDGTWSLMMAAGTWDALSKTTVMADLATEIRAGATPVDALSRVADKNITTPLADPTLTPVWCPNIKEMYASRPADIPPPPPPPTWVVQAATIGSRPVYEVVNGALVLRTGRATSGAACDCAAPFVSGTSTYCIPAGQTKFVALCTKKVSP